MEKGRLENIETLIIGGSAGSLEVILSVLPELKKNLSVAIIIVLHRKVSFDSTLADLFATKTKIPVKEADEKEPVAAGHIYIAPADYHLLIEQEKSFSLDYSEKILYSRPAIDVTFQTGSIAYGQALAALLLSGANTDGTEGLYEIQRGGGIIAVQDPEDAEIDYMPRQALLRLTPDFILKATEIAAFINTLGPGKT